MMAESDMVVDYGDSSNGMVQVIDDSEVYDRTIRCDCTEVVVESVMVMVTIDNVQEFRGDRMDDGVDMTSYNSS
jgi:hypothetical protein